MKTLDLNGSRMPALGFGTWQVSGPACERSVSHALELGYRHIDTAVLYRNEEDVGRAINSSAVPREDIFLTTKVWKSELAPHAARASVAGSLERLGVDYIDLILIHWPNPAVPVERTLEVLFQCQSEGLVRQVGVSNFPTALMKRALDCGPIVANQVEYHPYLDQSAVREMCVANGLTLTAYSPLARGAVISDPTLQEIGRELDASSAQVALAWLLQQPGVSAVPKATSASHRASNLKAAELELSAEQVQRIDALARPDGRLIDPPHGPSWD